jgi:hypothetical protein
VNDFVSGTGHAFADTLLIENSQGRAGAEKLVGREKSASRLKP